MCYVSYTTFNALCTLSNNACTLLQAKVGYQVGTITLPTKSVRHDDYYSGKHHYYMILHIFI